jgi:hypothetical protein
MCTREFGRGLRVLRIGTNRYHTRHTGFRGATQHIRQITGELLIGQVAV